MAFPGTWAWRMSDLVNGKREWVTMGEEGTLEGSRGRGTGTFWTLSIDAMRSAPGDWVARTTVCLPGLVLRCLR